MKYVKRILPIWISCYNSPLSISEVTGSVFTLNRDSHFKKQRAKIRRCFCRSMTKPYIEFYIQDKISANFDKLRMTQEMVIRELAIIAFANVTDCEKINRQKKNLADLDFNTTEAIKFVQVKFSGYSVVMHDIRSSLLKLLELERDGQ